MGIELNAEYVAMARRRIGRDAPPNTELFSLPESSVPETTAERRAAHTAA